MDEIGNVRITIWNGILINTWRGWQFVEGDRFAGFVAFNGVLILFDNPAHSSNLRAVVFTLSLFHRALIFDQALL